MFFICCVIFVQKDLKKTRFSLLVLNGNPVMSLTFAIDTSLMNSSLDVGFGTDSLQQ